MRLSGQDSERGTFSQRHSVLIDQETERRYTPLKYVSPSQGRFEVINSMLSEEAVLAFEYGYTLTEPNALVMWEAQFGDFANGAQVVFDQFISSGERKWLQDVGPGLPAAARLRGPGAGALLGAAGAVPAAVRRGQLAGRQLHDAGQLLPHPAPAAAPQVPQAAGADDAEVAAAPQARGLGPGRDGARHDASIACCGTMRSRARARRSSSRSDDEIRRVVLCSGKVYYDLYEAREAAGIDDVYLMRVEQLYPFPARALITELSRFPKAEIVWAQEEPKNMGAWSFVEPNIEWVLQHTAAAQRAAALRRPPGVGGHGDGPRQQAQSGAEGAGRAGALRLDEWWQR